MSYKINFESGAVCLPTDALTCCGELLQARFLMLLSYDKSLASADDAVIAEHLGCTVGEVTDTVAALRAIGLLAPDKKAVSRQSKNLDGEEISAIIDGDPKMRQMIDECEKICEKIFTPTDVSKVVSLKTELGFDSEEILLLFFYYHEKLDSVGRKLTVSYVEKSAYSLYNDGVRTVEQLQNYIKTTEERNSFNFRIRKLLGTGERAFTKKEKGFFAKWCDEWNMSFDLIEYAYEITVDKTGKCGLDYMSKILSDWHESGITTVEQAEKSSEDFKKSDKYKQKFKETSKDGSETPEKSFNTDEFFEKALRRSYALMGADDKGGNG